MMVKLGLDHRHTDTDRSHTFKKTDGLFARVKQRSETAYLEKKTVINCSV